MLTYEKFKELRKQGKYRYKLIGDSSVRNIQYIYPLKQKQVSDIVNSLKNYDYVKKIVIFGSSITDRCHEGSDLDIAIDIGKAFDKEGLLLKEAKDVIHCIEKITDYNCDKVFIGYEGDMLKDCIKNGVVVYEKEREEICAS